MIDLTKNYIDSISKENNFYKINNPELFQELLIKGIVLEAADEVNQYGLYMNLIYVNGTYVRKGSRLPLELGQIVQFKYKKFQGKEYLSLKI